ncbi:MAG: SAVED domain-containing protein, partial [Armatimonadetes bacterium]|nr:SAVED domain-containing protein [Armatimonadota bacterium]
ALADLADSPTSHAEIESRCRQVAREVLASRLSMIGSQVRADGCLRLRVSGKAPALAQEDDLLHVDGSQLFGEAQSVQTTNWERALAGLMDLRTEISRTLGELHLRIQGRLHLSLAVALGWVFRSPSGFECHIQQGQEMWATGLGRNVQHGLVITPADGTVGKGPLFAEVSVTHAVGAAARELASRRNLRPTAYLRVQPESGPSREAVVDNESCCAMAKAIGDALVDRCSYGDISEIHLFIAAPQALAVMIGRELNALPPVQLYEWDGLRYDPSIRFGVADLDT